MKISLSAIVLALIASVPAFAYAQQQLTNLQSVISYAATLGNAVVPIIISIGVIYLVVMIVKWFIIEPGEERTEALYKVLWAVLGLFLILSIWGLVNILRRTFQTDRLAPTGEFPRVFVPNVNTVTGPNVGGGGAGR